MPCRSIRIETREAFFSRSSVAVADFPSLRLDSMSLPLCRFIFLVVRVWGFRLITALTLSLCHSANICSSPNILLRHPHDSAQRTEMIITCTPFARAHTLTDPPEIWICRFCLFGAAACSVESVLVCAPLSGKERWNDDIAQLLFDLINVCPYMHACSGTCTRLAHPKWC